MMIAYTHTLFDGEVTESGDTSAKPMLTKHAKEIAIYLVITAVSGTNPTLNIVLKDYNSGAKTWHTVASFDQKTSTGLDSGRLGYGVGEEFALFYEVGGTDTPTFKFSINIGVKER